VYLPENKALVEKGIPERLRIADDSTVDKAMAVAKAGAIDDAAKALIAAGALEVHHAGSRAISTAEGGSSPG